MRDDYVEMLQETLRILKRGSYRKDGKTVNLKLSKKEMEEVYVLLPENVQEICGCVDLKEVQPSGACKHTCKNIDSFSRAIQIQKEYVDSCAEDTKPVLVLNMANPVHPGGGVRHGARAQEEDLCRKSSLLISLESKEAGKYYKYNRKLDTYMGSDAMIFTPKVEIIRDERGNLLDETVIAAVLTCAAPMVRQGKEGMSEEAYHEMVYNRITGMLTCAAHFNYKYLVLGAWGCGAFGNDAYIMSELFYKALKEIEFHGLREKDHFERIDFAVLDRSPEQYNFNEFYRNFAEEE